MIAITKQQAIDRLSQAIAEADPDDLVEIYNELFPEQPTTEGEAHSDPASLAKKVGRHIGSGLEVEEILDLWNVVFPSHREVWMDEDEDLIHFDEENDRVGQSE